MVLRPYFPPVLRGLHSAAPLRNLVPRPPEAALHDAFFIPPNPLRPPSSSSPSPSSLPAPHLTPFSPFSSPEEGPDPEGEVSDREWKMRVAQGMLHIRETLPLLFDSGANSRSLFPAEVYSRNVVLKLPPPLGLKLPGLHAYGLAFTIARNGLMALHHDCGATLERLTYSPHSPLSTSSPSSPSPIDSSIPARRQRQIRVMLSIHGTPRLPPHKHAVWHTSNLYTFSPYSGLVSEHEVEAIRPLPGEGVMEWIQHAVGGWTKTRPGTALPGTVRVHKHQG